ncbi:glycosyltransferase family 4 protein [Candidatus Woesebacteria bacterium]|nr:glycosyltransferase family 4 protein [Candidatus Woesebacteria bacterium]
MKIAIDGRFYGLEHAGLGRYTMNLIDQLQKLDNKNLYFILLRKKYFNTLNFQKKWRKVLCDTTHYSFAEQFKLPRLIRKINPDIYHALSINYPVLYKGKTVVTLHDLTQLSYTIKATTLPEPLYLIKHFGLKYVVKKATKNANSVLVPSKAVGRDLIDIHNVKKEKLKVIYEGVSISANNNSALNIPDKYSFHNKYFLYIGNAYPHKNLDRLIEAMKLINQKRKKNVLLIIGGSRDIFKKQLDKKIKQSLMDKYIKTVGYIPDEYMKYVYENSIGFVYPSLAEGFGLQGIEAMKAGTLLLASNIPVFKEIYKENALYFNPYDFSEIANTLELAITMSEIERKKAIEKARKFSERYSWKKMAEKTLEVYRSSVK